MAGLKRPPLIRAKHHAVTVSEKPKAKAMSAAAAIASAQRSGFTVSARVDGRTENYGKRVRDDQRVRHSGSQKWLRTVTGVGSLNG